MIRKKFLTAHVWEAAEQQGKEEIEDDQVADEDGGKEVGDARRPWDVDAVPHRLDPLSAKHPEDDHEAVHEVGEVPPRHVARPLVAHLVEVVLAEQLHPHHGEDEDDDAEDEGQVGQRADRVGHDGQDVVERLPRLCQLEDSQQPEGPQHRETLDTFGQKLDEWQDDDQEVETVPAVLKEKDSN